MDNSGKNKRVIAVIGVPRSGTSAITKGLQALGVGLGDYVSEEKRGDNEKGFFEDLEINMLNLSILNSVGYRWGVPVSPIINEDSRKIMAVFLPVAKDIIRRRLESSDIFGFKDPMIALILPFWKEIFEKTGADVSFVIACRNPLSMAYSLKRTNNLDLIVGFYVWLAGILSSLVYTDGFKRVLVDYDDILSDPQRQLGRMAKGLSLPFNQDDLALKDYADNFLTDSLRHGNFTEEDLKSNTDVPVKILELYALLKKISEDKINIDSPESKAVIKKIFFWAAELRSTLLYIQAQSDAMFSLGKTIEAKDKKIEELLEIINQKKA